MASLKYDDIFSLFLGNITDPTLASMEESEAYELLTESLHKAIAPVYVRRLFSSVSLDDEVHSMTYTVKKSVDNDSDEEFVKTMLAKSMAVQWVTPQVQSKINLAQMFTGSEFKFFSQASHLSESRAIKSDMEKDLQSYILARGYAYNDYLEG